MRKAAMRVPIEPIAPPHVGHVDAIRRYFRHRISGRALLQWNRVSFEPTWTIVTSP